MRSKTELRRSLRSERQAKRRSRGLSSLPSLSSENPVNLGSNAFAYPLYCCFFDLFRYLRCLWDNMLLYSVTKLCSPMAPLCFGGKGLIRQCINHRPICSLPAERILLN